MTIKVGNCQICGDYSKLISAKVPKTGLASEDAHTPTQSVLKRNLCSWCISQLFGISEKEAGEEIDRELESMYAQVVSK